MQNEQPERRNEGQADTGSLSEERKTRGETRNAHLAAGRAQAQLDNAEARARSETEPQQAEGHEGGYGSEVHPESEVRQQAYEAALKTEARSRYTGSDESFEQEWPALLEQLRREDMQRSQDSIRRRL